MSDLRSQADRSFDAGNACYEAGRFAEAAAHYQQVIRIAPGHCESHNNLGAALADLGQTDDAIACYLTALHLRPDYAEAHFNLGNALRRLELCGAARASFRRALELQPQRPEFHHGYADCCFRAGLLAESEAAYRRALTLRQDFSEVWTSLGLVLAEQGRFADAEACHTDALRFRPDDPQAHRNRSLVRLLLGDYRQGWVDYEWRWQCADFTPVAWTQPRWQGEPLPGGTILLFSEQGIGDTIQFVRYAADVRQLVGRVILATRRELIPILKSCAGIDQLVPLDELPAFDVYCPLLSLPRVLNSTVENVPAPVPYLSADPQRIAEWRGRLGDRGGLRVGICWKGSPGNKYYREHAIPAKAFAVLSSLRDIEWVSLQKGIFPKAEAADFPLPLHDFSATLDVGDGAFVDTAAVISLLDLVISFDTSLAHLAGALGKPVWIALPFVPDWRWLLEREDSPWYPTARLFRQSAPGNWDQPLRRMEEMLRRSLTAGTDALTQITKPLPFSVL